MNEYVERFASEYAMAEERLTGQGDGQSSIHYPTVFLFVGDKTADAIEPMIRINERKWDNSAGVMYVHAVARDGAAPGALAAAGSGTAGDGSDARSGGSRQHNPNHPQVTRLVLPVRAEQGKEKGKTMRKELYQQLYQNEGSLFELNRALRQVSHNIAEYGRLYASFDRIHLAVITRVDDPLNVFIAEIALLAEAIFSQSFKSVQKDLYALISEREQVEVFGYASSVGVAFLRELDYMQSADYAFSARLHVTEDGISIPVTHSASPLFDLVYVLSDKNERGISSFHDMDDNYDIICHMNLLKNRKLKDSSQDFNSSGYNNTSFKNNIMTETGRQGYVSAGFSRVKRPNQSIALAVLYHFCRELVLRMEGGPDWSAAEKLAFFGLDPNAMAARVAHALPDDSRISDMNGIMTHDVSFGQLKRMTLREAESALFGSGCHVYFQDNYAKEAEKYMMQLNAAEELSRTIQRRMSEQAQVGFHQVCEWTNEANESGSVWKDLHARMRDLARALDSARAELEQVYQERVEEQSFQRLPLMDKHNVRSFVRSFFDTVYRRKLELLRMETELQLYRRHEAELERLHAVYKQQVQQLNKLEHALREAALDSIRHADDYIGQNIMEYYGRVTATIMQDIEAKRGQGVFFEERYMGGIAQLLESGIEAFTARLIAVCRQHILTAEPFKQTFEEELLRRANVTIDYSNREVLSKDELFKKLYRTLEDHAGINIRLLDYTHEHRYEEKYFFGDAASEFIGYALSADDTSRIYKLGCVHEQRSSGVEKLNIMGGFHIEDMMYYRNGKVYYESYLENGYEFHGIDPGLLPELR
ncbi:transcription initiation factor TFIID [Paenibacillus apiarius]|uniref:Transcription initiation factor TFIID n=2 Tax=Paenibacillus apiarius TaxID=46240 RepID=A0ABT4DNQ7_9BACL|nr:transcription initiation factor TFIID [Paenibacillus apiarius]MCY9513009.1 transcription initiation factor TFIID [Paenibacillus apiarius]MCY9518993.1 transcription initiation factor TFIID [Paenibacillus apiarius]MCY9550802.1 transcription initiation factor TFIID [Paenibacillus apiarius]MCY9559764.1 transcription initiation factor TFIID [Paenibacillus apiarius]MCY9682007.1 transcription initiation factor TFIID [Paenibacillus apiarius]